MLGGMPLKAVIIVCDGMADRPVRELGYSTPLEAADTPGMDYLADVGVCGIIDPISPGTPPGSDVANLSLLGYDALKVYRGRVCSRHSEPGWRCALGTWRLGATSLR